jgi:hypothetical protein
MARLDIQEAGRKISKTQRIEREAGTEIESIHSLTIKDFADD